MTPVASGGRLALVYAGYPSRGGGVAQHLRQLQGMLPALGFEVELVSLAQVPRWSRLAPHAVQVALNAVRPPVGFYARYRVGRWLLRSVLARHLAAGLDGVIFEDLYSAFPVPVPSLTIVHALQSHNLQGFRVSADRFARARRIEAALIAGSDAPLVTVSEPYRRMIERDLSPFCSRLPSLGVVELGIDPAPFPVPPRRRGADRLELVFVGFLEPRKNLSFLADLVPALARRFDRFHLTVVGDGPQRGDFARCISERGVDRFVTFAGHVAHRAIPELLQRFHVMLHPTLVESFAYTLLEGRLAGLTTVCPPALAVPEDFCDVRLPLDVEAWADHVASRAARLMEPPSDARLGDVRRLRERYSVERMTREYLGLLGHVERRLAAAGSAS